MLTAIVSTHGTIRCLYTEALDLETIGRPTITRASHVEPDESGQWWADLSPVNGPHLGPFAQRSAALAAEIEWIETHVL